ncbi:MAG: glycosyltransferase family 4 protein [Chitinophagaceae bacterium]
MRVLWFANTPCNAVEHMKESTIGGGWLQTLDLHMQEKVELHIAFYANWPEETFTCRKATYHVIPSSSIRVSNVKNIFFPHVIHQEDTLRYLDIVNRVKPDLIHLHGTENAYGTMLSKVNVPVVVSIQGIMTPYAYRFGGDAAEDIQTYVGPANSSLKGMLFEKGQKHTYDLLKLTAARETKYIRDVKYFIGRTIWDRRVSSVMSPGSHYFIGDEIMRDVFYTKQWNQGRVDGKWIIHTTASDHPMKGFRTIVDTVNLLISAGIQLEWRVAGLSAQSTVVRVAKKQLGKAYPLDHIKLLGRIGADALADMMAEANMFVLPSFMENSPNSLCEAMMMGMPCVATNGGGTPSMLEDKVEGLLVQPRDPWAMAGAILELISDQESAIAFGQAARRTALKRHEPTRIVNQVFDAYQQILQA